MSVARLLRYGRLAYFAKPKSDRMLYGLVRRNGVRRVVEVGIDSLERTSRMLKLALDYAAEGEVRYTGVDPFEERPVEATPLPLIEAHRELRGVGASVRLTPGNTTAVAAMANSLADTDLLLLSAGLTDGDLTALWRYVPRMCHPGTAVLRAVADGWDEVSLEAISRLGQEQSATRAA